MRMRRREFILGLAMLAYVGRAGAQDRVRRVGVLIPVPSDDNVLETILKEGVDNWPKSPDRISNKWRY